MDRTALFQMLRQIIEKDLGEAIDNLNESTSLREELGLDSVDLVTMVVQVQDRLGIVLDSSELEPISTVADLLDLIQKKSTAVAHRSAA